MSSFDNSVSVNSNLVLSGNVLNRQLQTIQVNGQLIRLRSKLWQVLEHLVENRNNLVPRQTLIDICWNGNGYTGEQGLTHTICHLRRIIKKFGIEAKITTIPKRGYVLQEINLSHDRNTTINMFPYNQSNNRKTESSILVNSFMRLG